MSIFERFDKHKTGYCYLLAALYFIVNNGINASSVWMEYSRNGSPTVEVWEPVTWEYSSAISVLLLLPALAYWFASNPPRLGDISRQIVLHLIGSLIFSICHVVLMVWLRELIYALRSTLSSFTDRFSSKGFSRIHRSHIINNQAIDNIRYYSSGDGEVTLRSGKILSLSRRYKDDFKQAFC
ncbi:LytTR family transcriptional regulator [Alteromonas pelagimontana]|uniref:LytTR family transcriptional regulator n=1 Tax=Alteromonas pelagimontana TaxID=1858656 RepID=A0A6M4MAK9_9ALTE|nr:LytTR family DNA-binding domain-containing protein [Alteromonas pelagimontana]QJR80204.1 LytTR family transcriptional regulator [Alteromonas pelagimontana]